MKTNRILTITLMLGMLAMFSACSGADALDGAGDGSVAVPDDVVSTDGNAADDGGSDQADIADAAGTDVVRIVKTASVKNCTVGTSCRREFAAVGAEEIAWTIEGALPDGIIFEPKPGSKLRELMSGTPTVEGVFPITLVAKDIADETNSDSFAITIKVKAAASSDPGDGGASSSGPSIVNFGERINRIPLDAIRKLIDIQGDSGASDLKIEKPGSQVSFELKDVLDAGRSATLELKASGGTAPYTWEYVPPSGLGALSTWTSDDPVNGDDCGAEQSQTCSVTFNHIASTGLFTPLKDPLRTVTFRVKDAAGHTAERQFLAVITYPQSDAANNGEWTATMTISYCVEGGHLGDTYTYYYYRHMDHVGDDPVTTLQIASGDQIPIGSATFTITDAPLSKEGDGKKALCTYSVSMLPGEGHSARDFLQIGEVTQVHIVNYKDNLKTHKQEALYHRIGWVPEELTFGNEYWRLTFDNRDTHRNQIAEIRPGMYPGTDPNCQSYIDEDERITGYRGGWIIGSLYNDDSDGRLLTRIDVLKP